MISTREIFNATGCAPDAELTSSVVRSLSLVIGIGGAGCNVVERMRIEGLAPGMRTITVNQEDAKRQVDLRVPMDAGQFMESEAAKQLQASIERVRHVVVVAGLGGVTGSTYLPILVREASQTLTCRVTAIAVLPFEWEAARHERTEEALESLRRLHIPTRKIDNEVIAKELTDDAPFDLCLERANILASQAIRERVPRFDRDADHPLIRAGVDLLGGELKPEVADCMSSFGGAVDWMIVTTENGLQGSQVVCSDDGSKLAIYLPAAEGSSGEQVGSHWLEVTADVPGEFEALSCLIHTVMSPFIPGVIGVDWEDVKSLLRSGRKAHLIWRPANLGEHLSDVVDRYRRELHGQVRQVLSCCNYPSVSPY